MIANKEGQGSDESLANLRVTQDPAMYEFLIGLSGVFSRH